MYRYPPRTSTIGSAELADTVIYVADLCVETSIVLLSEPAGDELPGPMPLVRARAVLIRLSSVAVHDSIVLWLFLHPIMKPCYLSNRFRPEGNDTPHSEDHPVQMIMTQRDFDAVYEGDSSKNYDACRIASFTCPYCGTNGLSLRSFASHILSVHAEPPVPRVNVICPMCIACPEFDANREIDNLKTHWTAFHAGIYVQSGAYEDAGYHATADAC
ncbi:unnamed protein product [Nippostrongylus brasiliensis]|uniref:Zf-Di19 domain-containing protein n=1 Tax=Nippostrongylus brasiliensis TaxID=27835 RepID=A0A158R1V7_NIPBR|nr:unnamed protein product [Nippostrongylus brasiliensis]